MSDDPTGRGRSADGADDAGSPAPPSDDAAGDHADHHDPARRGDGTESGGGATATRDPPDRPAAAAVAPRAPGAGLDDVVPAAFVHVAGSKWTFDDEPVREWVEQRLHGRVANVCCGRTRLRHDGPVLRNDLDESVEADHHVRVRDLPDVVGDREFDTVVFDPPWSEYQANTTYEGETVGCDRLMVEAVDELVAPGGQVLGFGYHGSMMPARMGYETREAVVFDPYGRRRSFVAVRDVRPNRQLGEY